MENQNPTSPPPNQANSAPAQPVQPETDISKDPVSPPAQETQTQSTQMPNRPKKSKKLLFLLIALIVITSLGLAGYFVYKNYQHKQITQPQPTPTPFSDPTPIASLAPSITPSVKVIDYKWIEDWPEYISETGYSFQHRDTFGNPDNSGEMWRDGSCVRTFGNNAGGIISAKVVPYSGGSRRVLYGIKEGYNYQFEEVIVQGKNSLIIEAGPIGDSGSGSGIVIPVGKHALILFRSNAGKSDQDFLNLIRSVKINESLDLAKCYRTTDEVTFTGVVTNITYGCFLVDGTCEVYVDNKRVIAQTGSEPEKYPKFGPRGQLIGINLNQSEKDSFMNKSVEVYGKMGTLKNYTIYGDTKYYIKLLN